MKRVGFFGAASTVFGALGLAGLVAMFERTRPALAESPAPDWGIEHLKGDPGMVVHSSTWPTSLHIVYDSDEIGFVISTYDVPGNPVSVRWNRS